jgi:hypothetical protein
LWIARLRRGGGQRQAGGAIVQHPTARAARVAMLGAPAAIACSMTIGAVSWNDATQRRRKWCILPTPVLAPDGPGMSPHPPNPLPAQHQTRLIVSGTTVVEPAMRKCAWGCVRRAPSQRADQRQHPFARNTVRQRATDPL